MERPGLRSRVVEAREGITADRVSRLTPDPLNDLHSPRLDQYPRNLFFQAVDHQIGPDALPEAKVKIIQNKRFADSRRLHSQLEELTTALKAVKSFDPMGNAGFAALNLEDLALDVLKQIRNFAAEVADAETRYREINDPGDEPPTPPQSPAVAVEPSPTVPATAGPKPGPGPTPARPWGTDPTGLARLTRDVGEGSASVHIFNQEISPADALSAFDRVIAARAASSLRGRR